MDSTQAHQVAIDFGRQVSVYAAQKKRRGRHENIWLFDSPKNEKRLVINGDVGYMHLVLLEGDPNVCRYQIQRPIAFSDAEGEAKRAELDAVVDFTDGHSEWWEFRRYKDPEVRRIGRAHDQLQFQAAQAAGIKHVLRTERDLRGKEILFDNWALLCAAINRARGQSRFEELRTLDERLNQHGAMTVGALLEEPNCDPAVMLAVIATSLQDGAIVAKLEHRLFSTPTLLERRPS